jgi:hypothetical protein
MRSDCLRLLARRAEHAGDPDEALRICHQYMAACEASPDALSALPQSESVARLALAACDMADYALSAAPASFADARQKITRTTAAFRAAHQGDPTSDVLACGLARCLNAMARLSLHDGPGSDMDLFLAEAAGLMIDTPTDSRHAMIPLIWKISKTATEWAGCMHEHPDLARAQNAVDLARRFTASVMRNGDERLLVLIQRARIHLYQSRLASRSGDRQLAVRFATYGLRRARLLQANEPRNQSLTLLTAQLLKQAISLSDAHETKWMEDSTRLLDELLRKLADDGTRLTPSQQLELAELIAFKSPPLSGP